MQLQHKDLRVVMVHIPGGLPRIGWNVDDPNAVGYRGISKEPMVPKMRQGLLSNYRVEDGPFEVRFNTGLVLR